MYSWIFKKFQVYTFFWMGAEVNYIIIVSGNWKLKTPSLNILWYQDLSGEATVEVFNETALLSLL